MALHIVVHPRFGDTARVTTETSGRPQLVAGIDTGGTFSVEVDDCSPCSPTSSRS